MWKWASTKGGETRWPAASSTGAAPPSSTGPMAAIRPARMATSWPVRPSGRVALRTIRSLLMGIPSKSSPLPFEIRHHQGSGIVGPPGDGAERRDRQEIGEHEEDLARHGAADGVLEPQLERVEGAEQQGPKQRLARTPGGEHG